MKKFSTLFIILILTAFSSKETFGKQAYDNFGMGVLNVKSQSIVQSLRLTLPIVVPGAIKKGVGVHADVTWTNVWAQNNTYLLDYEMLEYSAGFTYGTGANLGYALYFVKRRYIGGAMDNLIQRAHDLEGISQNGRDDYPRNRSIISIYDEDTDTWTHSPASDLNNLGANFLVNYELPGNWFFPAVNVFGVLRYNIESPDFLGDLDDFDYCLGIGFSKRLSEKLYGYAVFGYSDFSDDVNTGENTLEFHKTQKSAFLAFAWHYNPSLSIVLQYLYGGPMVKNIEDLNENSHELHLGCKMRFTERFFMDFSLIENTINMDNSPDFGFHLGFSYFL